MAARGDGSCTGVCLPDVMGGKQTAHKTDVCGGKPPGKRKIGSAARAGESAGKVKVAGSSVGESGSAARADESAGKVKVAGSAARAGESAKDREERTAADPASFGMLHRDDISRRMPL